MKRHPGFSNWKDFALHLEEQAETLQDAQKKNSIHMEVARIWDEKFLDKRRAVLHYQKAFKADGKDIDALGSARRLYWEVGRLKTIERLVELQAELVSEPEILLSLYREVALAMLVLGDRDKTLQACAHCSEQAKGDPWAEAIVSDLKVGDGWAEAAREFEEDAKSGNNPAENYFRVALLHLNGGAPTDTIVGYLRKSVIADPGFFPALLAYEQVVVENSGKDGLEDAYGQLLDAVSKDHRDELKYAIGIGWIARHSRPDLALGHLRSVFRHNPNYPGLLGFLGETYTEQNQLEEFSTDLKLALTAVTDEEIRIDMLEVAGLLSKNTFSDLKLSAHYFGELLRVDPDNAVAAQFFEENEMTIDDSSDDRDIEEDSIDIEEEASSANEYEQIAHVSEESEAEPIPEEEPEMVDHMMDLDRSVPDEFNEIFSQALATEAEDLEQGIRAWQEIWASCPGHPEVVDALVRLYSQTEKWHALADFLKKQVTKVDNDAFRINAQMALARIYDEHIGQDVMVVNTYSAIIKSNPDYLPAIDAAIVKYEAMNRWPDLVKMLKAKGTAVTDPEQKVEIFLQVAKLFLERFSNQAEAIKAFEEVLDADPNHPMAIDYLKDMYEKRRDWEKLTDVMQKQAEQLPDGPEKVEAFVEIARLTTERLKRPDVCIQRWETVLEHDPENAEAFKNLSSFYERAKEWEKLAAVLERQMSEVPDDTEKIAILQKMGQVYGEKIGDDNKAAEAWKILLEIDPNDRRAQEQLKKRYLAMQAWDQLEEFYASTEKWDEFIRVLERESEKPDQNVEDQVALQFKIADLWKTQKSRTDRAARCYDKILSVDPDNLQAAEELIPILEEGKEKERLADVLEVRLKHLDDPIDQIMLLRRIASIAEDEIGNPERAFRGFLQAFELQPDDNETQNDLERAAGKANLWEEVVDAYKRTISQHGDAADFELRLRLARVLDEELKQHEDALAYYDAILSEDAKNAKAVAALEKIFAQMGRYEELLDIYARRLEMAEDDEERKEILYNQALLWEEEVGDCDKAIEVLLQIIEMAGDETRVLNALDRLYTKEERWGELADVLERALSQFIEDQEVEVDLKFRLGQVSDLKLDNKEKALECYREILIIVPEHEGATNALEALLENESQQAEAARILAPFYEERGQFEKLVAAIEILIKHSDDSFENYENLLKIGEIYTGQLGSPERAFVAYSRAFTLNPAEPRALQVLEEITIILDSWKELVALLEKGGEQIDDVDIARNLWLRAAQIQDEQLENPERAIAAYHNALRADPHNREAVEALEQIYGRTEKWDDLVKILQTKVDLVLDVVEKEHIYSQMAMILEEMLGRPEEAVSCLKEILNVDPTNIGALEALEKLLVDLELWTDLADNLQQQLSLGGDPDKITSLKLRLADLRESRLEEIGAAIEIYREVLETDYSNERAITALERNLENKDYRSEVAQILEPIYRANNAWAKLVGIYEIMIEEDDEPARKVELFHQMSELYETAGDEPEKAFRTLGRALNIDPGDERTQEELERLARVIVLFDDLATLYSEVVEEVDDPDLAAAYHFKIAQIYAEQIQDMDSAIRHYRAVLETDPMHLEAATALEKAYQITENYQDLAAIYLKKVEMVADLYEQKDFLFKASQIYEDIFEDAQKAIEVYLRVLDLDEDDLQALGHLEALYLRLERWEDLQEVYNKKVDLLESPEEKREVLYVLGAIYEREVNDAAKAIETYQRILEFDPDDIQAIQRLDVLFSEAEEWHDLLSILEREVELAHEPDEAVALKFRIGELHVKYLEDETRAVEYFREILTIAPDHGPTIAALEELLTSGSEPLLVADVLEPLYTEFGEWKKLVDVIEVKIRNTEDSWQRLEMLHQMAQMLESELHLDSPSEAFDVYARALAEDLVNEKTLTRLEDLAAQTGRWQDLATLFDKQLVDVVDVEQAIQIGLRAGAIYEEKLAQAEEAIERYKRVLEFSDDNKPALMRLDTLYQSQERWQDLTGVLQRLGSIIDEPEKSLNVQFRLGNVYQQELGDTDQAVAVYRDILASDPTFESATNALELLFAEGVKRTEIGEILEPLYRMQAEWQRLVSLYEAQLEDLSDPEDRVPMLHRIAEIQEDRVLDGVEAFQWYCRALAENPFDERSGEETERLADATNAWGDLADLYQDLFEKLEQEDTKVLCAKRLAKIAEEHLSDVVRAEQAYRGCLELGADDRDVLTALDRIYTDYMEWERLVEILRMLADISLSDDEKVAYIHRMGTIYETQLDESEKARQCFHQVIDDLDPNHSESLGQLEMIYANAENWSSLFNIYAKMKDATSSDADAADLYAKMAIISAECLNDIEKSIELWGNVLDILGEDPMALESLAELYTRQENWSDLVDILERAVMIAEDDASRVNIYSQLGQVWGERLSRDRNSLENWENVLSIDPENVGALKAIAAIHESNQEWDLVIETVDRIIAVGDSGFSGEELKNYHAKLGHIYMNILEQSHEAIDAWNQVIRIDGTDKAALDALEKLYTESEMWEELVDILGKKGQSLEGDLQLNALLQQASTYEEKLFEPRRAKTSYQAILEVAPLHDHAFQRLTEILTEEENWESLVETYFKRLNYLAENKERIPLYHKAAKIYEDKLNNAENAFLVMQRAFEEDYSNDDTAKHLERLASITGKWEELLQSCNQVLQTVDDKNVQINICLKIGKWYADELGHPEYAIAYYQQVLQLDSDNVPALRLIGELYRGTKQWDELVEVLRRAVDCEQDQDSRKELYVELGEIFEEYIEDIPQARNAYKAALELDPGLEEAINALERLLGAAQNWRELIPILRRKIEVVADNPDEVITTHMRIGEIFERNLDESQSAIEEYRQVLELDQGYIAALKGLERLYEKQERWQDLLDILEIQLEYATSERERIGLLMRISSMLEKEFVKPDQAAAHYEQVLEIDPSHEEALLSLERIYRNLGQWHDLIATLERHIEVIHERPAKIDYFKQMGEVYSRELDDPERAIDAYNEILEIDPEHEESLDHLAKLHAKREDWISAHDTLRKLAETVMEPDRKVDLYFRLGKLNEDHLMNRAVAVEHFRSALDINPGHLSSLSALRAIHLDEGEWLEAARTLEAEQESTEQPRLRSKLQYELGSLHADKLGDEELAIGWFEKALESDADNQQAAEPLIDVYINSERWNDAEPLLDMLVRLGGKRPSSEMQPLQRKYALVADKQGNLEKALKGYQAAHELDPSHLPTVLGLADIHFRMQEWDKAFKFYQMVLVHHRDKQSKDEIVEIFYRLGFIKSQVKERRKALNMYDKALEIDPTHKATITEIVRLHMEAKNYDQVIHYKKVLMDAVDENERFELLVEIGDIWKDHIKNQQKAISSYMEATELRPMDRPTLHKLLPLYQDTKQWTKVVEIIKRVTDMEEDETKLARLFYSMGVIYRDEIKSAEDAVEQFNNSLNHSLENLKAFEAIDRILTQRKDWKNLERNYRKMLHRISGKGRKDLEINLWHFLGEIYRTRMGQYEPAAEAFKMASNLDPDNNMRHEILAELFVSLPNRLDEAVQEYQWLIRKNPYHVDSYKALRRLYFDNRQYDKAWCLCATLSFLKKADSEEQQFFEQYRTRGMVRAQARLDNERWLKDLFHPGESVYVGKVFEVVTRAIRSLKFQPIKAFGLKKNQKRPPNDTMTFSKTFFYAAQVLNLPVIPDLYVQEDRPGALNFAITDPMATACGSSLLSGYSPQDLLFIVTKHLTYYRPEHYIRWVLPTHGELKMLLLASIKLGAPDFKLPADKSGVLQQYVEVLQSKLTPMEGEALRKVVKKYIKSGEVTDIKQWVNSVELTGCRSGLLLANDLEVAARMIQAEAGAVDEISPKEKIKELVLFSVSEEYFRLREALGITIGT